MSSSRDFIQYVMDLLEPSGPARARAMFGGYGVYRNELMIALIDDDAFYLRTDEATRPEFLAAGCKPFVYTTKDGKAMEMSYYEAPADAMEDADVMAHWAGLAFDAAVRAKAAKAAKAPKKPRKKA